VDLVNTLDQYVHVFIMLNFVSLLYISLAAQTNLVIVHVCLSKGPATRNRKTKGSPCQLYSTKLAYKQAYLESIF
jgi:hypothetical protein